MRPLDERTSPEPDPYSSDIAAAWQVLEALRPVHIELNYFPDQDACQCNIRNGPRTRAYRMTQEQWQPTSPMAICFAALKAVSHTLSEEVDHLHGEICQVQWRRRVNMMNQRKFYEN